MIQKEIAQAAIDLAEELDRRSIGLVAVPGSEVNVLTNLSTVKIDAPIPLGLTPEELAREYIPNAEVIEQESSLGLVSTEGSYGSQHADKLDELVTGLADTVAQHLSFARNTVTPAVREFHTRLTASLESIPTTATFNPVLVKENLPEPMLSSLLQSAISEYRTSPYVPVGVRAGAAEATAEEIIANMTTGNDAVDADVKQWLHRIGDAFVVDVWNAVFTTNGSPSATFVSMSEDRTTGVDAALVVFLLARRLLDNPTDNASNTLEGWRKAVGDLLVQSGLRLAHAFDDANRDLESQLLVLGYTQDVVTVFAPVYEQFIAAGGSDAILFGNILTDAPRLFAPAVLERATEFLENWERQNRILTARNLNNRYTASKSMIDFRAEELVAQNIKEFFPQLEDGGAVVLDVNHPTVAEAISRIRAMVAELTSDDLKDTWKLATRIVASGIFYYTDAQAILDGINKVCAANPEIDVKEASLIATIEYVADYVAAQLAPIQI